MNSGDGIEGDLVVGSIEGVRGALQGRLGGRQNGPSETQIQGLHSIES